MSLLVLEFLNPFDFQQCVILDTINECLQQLFFLTTLFIADIHYHQWFPWLFCYIHTIVGVMCTYTNQAFLIEYVYTFVNNCKMQHQCAIIPIQHPVHYVFKYVSIKYHIQQLAPSIYRTELLNFVHSKSISIHNTKLLNDVIASKIILIIKRNNDSA